MDKKDGGPVDLESLRIALAVMDDAADYLDDNDAAGRAEQLWDARNPVADALSELTARRARDAEVEALVAAAAKYADMSDALRDALIPFTGAKP